jgi:Protein of unknown function (DUF3147)
MTPKLRPRGLKRVKGWEYALRFLFGGIISAAASLVSHAWGPVVGGLLLAFPAILPASLTLVKQHDGWRQAVDDARGGRLGSVGLLAFAAVVWAEARSWSPAVTLTVATLAWVVVDAALWTIRFGPRREGSCDVKIEGEAGTSGKTRSFVRPARWTRAPFRSAGTGPRRGRRRRTKMSLGRRAPCRSFARARRRSPARRARRANARVTEDRAVLPTRLPWRGCSRCPPERAGPSGSPSWSGGCAPMRFARRSTSIPSASGSGPSAVQSSMSSRLVTRRPNRRAST